MMSLQWTTSQVADILQQAKPSQMATIERVVIDSRDIKSGDLFVAIVGERYDGHDFVSQAIERGAAAVLVAKPMAVSNDKVWQCVVPDTVIALGQLAHAHRQGFDKPMIALTGSCGKTTVKSLIAHILSADHRVLSTQGTRNNHIGVPLTLLELDPKQHDVAVLELGANHPGEIAYLTKMAEPTLAFINNVYPVHLEGFGSLDGIAHAKGELLLHLPTQAKGLVNNEDSFAPLCREYLKDHAQLSFGLSDQSDVYADNIDDQGHQIIFSLHAKNEQVLMTLPLLGRHNVINAVAAAAVCYAMGVSLKTIAAQVASFQPVYGRLVTKQGLNKAKVIDDSYNANPVAVKAALNILAKEAGEKIFVFANMGEVGKDALMYHQDVGVQAKQAGVKHLLCVGELTPVTVETFGHGAQHFATRELLIEALKPLLHEHVTVLIKGSRSQQLEHVVNAIVENTAK